MAERRYWGVMFWSPFGALGPLGIGWLDGGWPPARYPGEPGRAMLFLARREARAWCQQKAAFYSKYPDGHVCRAWRFRPVKVREHVTVWLTAEKFDPTRQTCKACGRPDKFDFHVPDTVWTAVVPAELTNRVVCLGCFDGFAREKGVAYGSSLTTLFFAGDQAAIEFKTVRKVAATRGQG